MSLKAITWVFDENVRPASLKLVLIALADNAGATAEAWPSIAVIAQKASLSRRQVIRALHELEKRGLIQDTGRRIGPTKQVKIYSLGGGWETKGDKLSPVTSTTERVTPTARKGDTGVTRNPIEPKEPKNSLPAENEIQDFCESLKLPRSDGTAMLLHWQERKWPKSWKLTIQKWKAFGYLPSQKAAKYGTNKKRSAENSRSVGTLNEGKASQYRGVGKVD